MSSDTDLSECFHCDREREGHSYLVLYGSWDPEDDGFERPPETEPVCRECWNERYDRIAGAHYKVQDPQRLWDILRAADGDLVADLKAIFVGSRPFIRIVDDELQAVKPVRRVANQPVPKGEPIELRFDTKHVDVDREWFFETLGDAVGSGDARPTIAVLRPVEETPFADVRERGGDSYKLEAFHHEH